MTLHALDVLGDAVTATRTYRPRGLVQWLWVAFVAVLVGSPGIGLPSGTSGGTGGGGLTPEQRSELSSELSGPLPPGALEAVVAILAALVVVWVVFLVLGAMLEFPFLAWLRTGEVDTWAEIREHLGQALGLAVFRLAVSGLGLALMAALVVTTVGTGGSVFEYLEAVAALVVLFGLVGFLTGIVTGFTTAFVVPTMILEDTGVLGGWRRFWGTLVGAPKQFLAYAVAVAVLAAVGGLLVFVVALLATVPALIVGGILGVVVVLAGATTAGIVIAAAFGAVAFTAAGLAAAALVQVFLRYYALFVLGSVDGDLDFARERRRAVGAGDDEDTSRPSAGTDDPQIDPR